LATIKYNKKIKIKNAIYNFANKRVGFKGYEVLLRIEEETVQ